MNLREVVKGLFEKFNLKEDLFSSLFYICGQEALPKPLTYEEETCQMIAFGAGDENAKVILIEHNLRLVVYIARKFENTGVDTEDLISIGSIGLIKAINSFSLDKKIKLATYASRCIENEILMHLRRISKLRAEVSFDEPLNVDYEGNELLLSDVLGTEGDIVYRDIERNAEHEVLKRTLGSLSEREQEIIELRYGLNGRQEKTQKEVADLMGISQSYISRLEKKIIGKMRKEMAGIL
ncbi:MAG: RNA polymerase sporulation sigma factor SigE [Clostridia bacterium]|nr:RNA polymerase sporulation sigma factor SigE [Clostridia bacterium]